MMADILYQWHKNQTIAVYQGRALKEITNGIADKQKTTVALIEAEVKDLL